MSLRSRRYACPDREEFLQKMERLRQLREEKRGLINRKFRGTPLYKATWVVRVLYFVFFTWILLTRGGVWSTAGEEITGYSEGIYLRLRSTVIEYLRIETGSGVYEIHVNNAALPGVDIGETVQIERNVFGKAAYITMPDRRGKYPVAMNWIIYGLIAVATLVSFGFNDATDNFTDKVLWVAWTADIFGFVYYFMS